MALCATGLAVGYDRRPVLSGITLGLLAGQSLALVGTNGSGKSTLLKTLAGLLAPIEGRSRCWAEPGRAPGRVAYLAQFHAMAGSCRSGRWTWCAWAATPATACSAGCDEPTATR